MLLLSKRRLWTISQVRFHTAYRLKYINVIILIWSMRMNEDLFVSRKSRYKWRVDSNYLTHRKDPEFPSPSPSHVLIPRNEIGGVCSALRHSLIPQTNAMVRVHCARIVCLCVLYYSVFFVVVENMDAQKNSPQNKY